MQLLNIFRYFTIWGLILQLVYYSFGLTRFSNSMLLILVIIYVGGLFITYIYPGYILLDLGTIYRIEGLQLILIDILFHQIPFYVFMCYYGYSKMDNLLLGLLVVYIYLIFNNPLKIYLGYYCLG